MCLKPRGESESTVRCQSCNEKHKRINNSRSRRRRLSGRCIWCGKPVEPWLHDAGLNYCQEHLDRQAIHNVRKNL